MIPPPAICDVREIHSVLRTQENVTSKIFQNVFNTRRLDTSSIPEIRITGKAILGYFISFVLVFVHS
jgi:hypothetical protein